MSVELEKSQPIDLPGLKSSAIDTLSADVRVGQTEPGAEHPQLLLEGDEGAFDHTFENGHLTVNEGGGDDITVRGNGSTVIIGGGGSSVSVNGRNVRAGNVIVGSNITMRNGVMRVSGGEGTSVVIGDDIEDSARRRALLLLPEGHEASHDISTQSGDVDLDKLTARVLKVASQSGGLALEGVSAEKADLETMSGNIDMAEVTSPAPIRAKTMSGNVDMQGGSAPSWNVETMSGNIRAKSVEGELDTSTMSGRTRVS